MIQPQYSLGIKNEYCSFMAYVNDVPAILNPDGYAFNLNVPINHLIQPGKNVFRISVTMQDESDDTLNYGDCIGEILVKGINDPMTSLQTCSKVDIRSLVKGAITSLPPKTPVSGIFQIEHQVSELPWAEAQDMSKQKSQFSRLAMDAIRDLHRLLKKKDLPSVFSLLETREKHYSSRYFEDFAESFSKTQEDFIATLEDADFELQELDFSTYLPVFYANGKLITFENSFGEQPIFYLNNKANLRRQYPVYFKSNDRGEMQIAL
jgi:hypothetical protein